MRTTIDAAGRIVVPKRVRDAMGLTAGRVIDVVYTDGRIEIELAPAEVAVETADGLPRLVPVESLPELTDGVLLQTIDTARQ